MKNALGTKEDLELFDKNGVKVYSFYACTNGLSVRLTYDSHGHILTHKDSDKFWSKYTRDLDGNELTYINSDGEKRGFVTLECTIEELFNKVREDFELLKSKHHESTSKCQSYTR